MIHQAKSGQAGMLARLIGQEDVFFRRSSHTVNKSRNQSKIKRNKINSSGVSITRNGFSTL